MSELNFRQVNLDFHTSECIDGIGAEFDKKEFQQALIEGHVNSVTLFSKCHHGWSYYPTDVNMMHPNLKFDLLGAQLEACKEIGVTAPIYISAGFDEKEAVKHPDWTSAYAVGVQPDFINAFGYHLLCFNTPYMDLLENQIKEVMQKYNPTEVFLDIVDVRKCYCKHCLASMEKLGLDPKNDDDVVKMGEITYKNYAERVERAVRMYNPDTKIFHNAGNVFKGRRDIAGYNTHLELESLPTGGWGYDHFPMSAAYARTLNMEYLGMTGKFHSSWGEFGGFKHPNALRYETSLSIALGAKCSIGDQLHPSGKINMSTYRLIGKAYSEIEQKEEWCKNATAISDIAILSTEVFAKNILYRNHPADIGASRILLEGKYLFDIIDLETDFSKYKLLILPDSIRLDDCLAKRLEDYLAKGGKILASGQSGLNKQGDSFSIDLGAKYIGECEYRPTYFVPGEELAERMVNGATEYVMYEKAQNIESKTVPFGYRANPYFNRTKDHFCSHMHTPNLPGSSHSAVVVTNNTAYIAWNLFTDYALKGSLHIKEIVVALIDLLLGDEKTITTSLPDRGVITLNEQKDKNRLVNHLLFSYTTKRGTSTEIIEDSIPLYNTKVKLNLAKPPKRVYLAPQGKDLNYEYSNGVLSYCVPEFVLHQMIVIDM